jgi:alpha-glucosidase (family GH31 glycosyl hydrolase)
VRPLFYEFPNDRRTYSIGDQFMIGDSILVCPMTAQGSDSNLPTRSCYFPSATWYDYYSGAQLPDYINSGNSTTITPALASINLYVRNGTAFVTQVSKFSVTFVANSICKLFHVKGIAIGSFIG